MSATNALAPISGSNGYQQQIEFDPTAPLKLSVSNASGEIRIVASEQPNIWVVVRRASGNHDLDDAPGITVDIDGNTISVHPDWTVASGLGGLARRIKDQLKEGLNPDDWNISKMKLHPDLEYDIRVEVPKALAQGSKVVAKTASGAVRINGLRSDLTTVSGSGRIRIEDVEGRVSSHTASGSVQVEGIRGSLEVNSASGSVTVSDVDAWAAIRTVSGSIKTNDARLRNARFVTVSGSVKGDFQLANTAEYLFESVSGSFVLDVVVPKENSRATLGFRSVSGSSKSIAGWVEEGRKNWTFGSGTTGPELKVKTVSGSLTSNVSASADVIARNEPLPAARHEDDGEENVSEDDHRMTTSFDQDFDFDEKIDKMVSWAKDMGRSFANPDPPTAPAPPTSNAEAAPPTPHTSVTGAIPPAPQSLSQAATPPSGAMETTDTQPLESARNDEQSKAPIVDQETPAANDDAEIRADLAADKESQTNRSITTDDASLSVLEALERGDIDIDEALARIEKDKSTGA